MVLGTVPIVLGTVPMVLGTVPMVSGTVPMVSGTVPMVLGTVPMVLGTVPMVLPGSIVKKIERVWIVKLAWFFFMKNCIFQNHSRSLGDGKLGATISKKILRLYN